MRKLMQKLIYMWEAAKYHGLGKSSCQNISVHRFLLSSEVIEVIYVVKTTLIVSDILGII